MIIDPKNWLGGKTTTNKKKQSNERIAITISNHLKYASPEPQYENISHRENSGTLGMVP